MPVIEDDVVEFVKIVSTSFTSFFIGKEDVILLKKTDKDGKAFAQAAAQLANQLHCSDVIILDLKGKSPATDYFVIATGTSDRQMRSVADDISEAARDRGLQRFGRAGYDQARWILLDFVDVVIHIFDSEYRDYYELELLWGDAKEIEY